MGNLITTAAGILLVLLLGCVGCVKKPNNIQPVTNFDVNQYVGKWYEIARLDNRFEKGMTYVYAEYSLQPNGSLKVVNSGFKPEKEQRVEAKGVAKFVNNPDVGYLKVSFFRPFYGEYVVFRLDPDYQYAYVSSNSTKYLWLLARTPSLPETVKQDFIEAAQELGVDPKKIIWTQQ